MNIFDNSTNLQLLLVHAGSTELDDQGRITGALDVPLSEDGLREARDLAAELSGYEIDAIFSAKCMAANQTANELSRKGKVKVRVEESWTNLDHGLWHGKSIEELKENQPKLYRKWADDPETICPPGGETFEEVRKRVSSSLKRIKKKYRTGVVALVAPEPLYSIIRSEVEKFINGEPGSTKQSSNRWEAIDLANAVA